MVVVVVVIVRSVLQRSRNRPTKEQADRKVNGCVRWTMCVDGWIDWP